MAIARTGCDGLGKQSLSRASLRCYMITNLHSPQSSFDQALRGEETTDPLLADDWMQQRTVLDDLDFVPSGFWGPSAPNVNGNGGGPGPSRQ